MDMYEFGAMEAALSFDLENDPDLVAIEANLDTIDYALESARIEYNISGDSRYAAVLEAAEEKQKSGIKDWFGTLAKKVSLFVKNAIQSVRAALSRLANAIRLKKASSMGKKLEDKYGKTGPVSAGKLKMDAATYSAMTKGLASDPSAAIDTCITNFISQLKQNGSIDKDAKSKAKADIFTVTPTAYNANVQLVDAKVVKNFLDNAVKYLNALGKSFPKAKDRINKENATGTDKGVIRVATSSAYNVVTAAVKEYYTNAMKLANAACKGGKAVEKATKKAEKAAKKENK